MLYVDVFSGAESREGACMPTLSVCMYSFYTQAHTSDVTDLICSDGETWPSDSILFLYLYKIPSSDSGKL